MCEFCMAEERLRDVKKENGDESSTAIENSEYFIKHFGNCEVCRLITNRRFKCCWRFFCEKCNPSWLELLALCKLCEEELGISDEEGKKILMELKDSDNDEDLTHQTFADEEVLMKSAAHPSCPLYFTKWIQLSKC